MVTPLVPHRPARWVVPLVVLALMATALFAIVGWEDNGGASVITLSVLQLGTVGGVLLVVRAREGRLDPLNPTVLIATMFPFMYTFQLAILSSGSDPLTSSLAPWLQSQSGVQRDAALLACAGLLCVLVGHLASTCLSVKKTRGAADVRQRAVSLRGRAFIATCVGLTLLLALVLVVGGPATLFANLYNRTQFFESINYLANGPLLMTAAVAALLCRRNAWPPSKATMALALLTLTVSSMVGSKTNLVVDLVLWGGIIHQLHRPFKWREIVAAVVILVLVLPFYDLYFRNAVPRDVPLSQVVDEQGGLVQSMSRLAADTFFGEQALGIALAEFPAAHPYTGADSFLALALAPIPRGLLPDKPQAPSGTFTDAFAPSFHLAGSTIPPTALGEMYMSGGWAGVMLGCIALGYGTGIVYRRRKMGLGQAAVAALTAATVLLLIRGESYGVGVLYLFILIPLLWIIRGGGEGRHFRKPLPARPS